VIRQIERNQVRLFSVVFLRRHRQRTNGQVMAVGLRRGQAEQPFRRKRRECGTVSGYQGYVRAVSNRCTIQPIRAKIADMKLEFFSLVLRLDCLSCVLTVFSTILVGRRYWEGWVLAAVNSLIICVIGLRTAQLGFIPANLFCIVLYAVNLRTWRKAEVSKSADFADASRV
jgi:hypothetical protein